MERVIHGQALISGLLHAPASVLILSWLFGVFH